MNVPKLRFKEFRNEWHSCKIDDFCKILMCKRIFANETSQDYEIPFYKIGTIGGTPDTFISKKLFDIYKIKYNYPKKGELLVTCSGTVGKCIIFDGKDSYYQDSNIVWLDNPTLKVSNRFLYYLLSRVDWSKLNSTTITRIYSNDLKQLKINYPEKEEQNKITNLLELLDKKILLQTKKIEALKLFKLCISNLCFNDHKNWNYKISDFCDIITSTSKIKYIDSSGKRYIMDMGTINSDGNIIYSKPTNYDKDLLNKGDLIMPKDDIGGGLIIGKTAYIDQNNKYILGDHVFCLKNKNINSLYLHYLINSSCVNKSLRKKVTGSAQLGINSKNVLNQDIFVHEKKGQDVIANTLFKIDSKVLLNKIKLEKLLSLKKRIHAKHVYIN